MNKVFDAGKKCGAVWFTGASFSRLLAFVIVIILIIITTAAGIKMPMVLGLPMLIVLVCASVASMGLSIVGDVRTAWCAAKRPE